MDFLPIVATHATLLGIARKAAVFCSFHAGSNSRSNACVPPNFKLGSAREVGIYGDQDDFALILLEDADGETIQLTEDSR